MMTDRVEPEETSATVSELARNVAALIRRVEAGEEIIITRDDSPVAVIASHFKPNGAALIALFEGYGPDPQWAELIEESREFMWGD
ncbi:type II toxin-antitoxin system Phd/YefM family antitoxin [Nonomuraea sp. NPDC049028]|uniref:type II toxin-antitoxin system Phd/YefM family antitoxin n=1 Tax=Nonomuraea sp. NPDC049028 TaxID=3364348 RepID=UPI00371007ED